MNGDGRFLVLGLITLAGVGSLMFLTMLAGSMAPAADAAVPVVVDLSTIGFGERRSILAPRRFIFIVHRTPAQIASVRADDDARMPSPERDAKRVQRAEWLVVEGRPEGSYFMEEFGHNSDPGRYGGWYAPYRDQHYDLSGRLREGRGTTNNLPVPDYYFLNNTTLVIE